MEEISKNEYKEIIKNMLKQSARNIEFRELLRTSPKEAMEEIAEKDLPDNINVKLIEEDGKITQILVTEKYTRSFYWDREAI